MRHIRSLLLALLFLPNALFAQGWQHTYGGAWDDRAFALQILPDGALLAAGSSVPDSAAASAWYILRTDAWGGAPNQQRFGAPDWEEAPVVLMAKPGNGWLMAGNSYTENASLGMTNRIALVSIDTSGLIVGPGSFLNDNYSTLYEGLPWNDGFLLLGTENYATGSFGIAPHVLYAKVDTAGIPVWFQHPVFGQNDAATGAIATPDGGAIIAGWYLNSPAPSNFVDIFALRINAMGEQIDTLLLQLPELQTSDHIVALPNDHYLIIGQNRFSINPPDVFIVAIDANLDTTWTRNLPIPGLQKVHTARVLPEGRILLAGETSATEFDSRDAFLACIDTLGNLLWYKTYGGLKGDIFWDVQPAPDGGFVLAGQTASFGNAGLQAWLVRTDSLGNAWSNTVAGRVLRDTLMNCLADTMEPALGGWLVTAAGGQGSLYALSDSLGEYAMNLDTGAWYLSVLPPAGYWTPCEDSIPLVFNQFYQDTLLDFPVQAAYDCPFLYVDITTPFLRRCSNNTYAVKYFNYGPAPAPDATVSIILDPYLSPVSASLPYTAAGDTLLFQLGAVPSLSGGLFTLTAFLDCDSTVTGQVHCTTANIAPDSLCYQFSPDWDGSNLVVNGYCAGDSVVLTIANTGLGNMSQPVGFVITEDQIIFKQALILLAAGQDSTFVVYPNGATVTIIVPQTPGHPGQSVPTLVIEGCGGFPFSTGFALQFPSDDGDPFSDTECRANVGSFDPNEKIGLPYGVSNAGIVAAGSAIEYLIHFQNTGTDTAFRVDIRDTLPAGFDIASLEPGAASHPYHLAVQGSGVLRFVFDPVALPDSGANAAASQGFVKFRINTRRNLPAGTVLNNRAGIYFDYNAGVLTGFTHHTIGDPLKALQVDAPEVPNDPRRAALVASPNPFQTSTQLSWPPGRPDLPYRIVVEDVLGRTRCTVQVKTNQYRLGGEDLPSGTYFVRIEQAETLLGQGKIQVFH